MRDPKRRIAWLTFVFGEVGKTLIEHPLNHTIKVSKPQKKKNLKINDECYFMIAINL